MILRYFLVYNIYRPYICDLAIRVFRIFRIFKLPGITSIRERPTECLKQKFFSTAFRWSTRKVNSARSLRILCFRRKRRDWGYVIKRNDAFFPKKFQYRTFDEIIGADVGSLRAASPIYSFSISTTVSVCFSSQFNPLTGIQTAV